MTVAAWNPAPAAKPKSRSEIAEALANQRWHAAVKVRQEWLDFEGLSGKSWSKRQERGGFAIIEPYLKARHRAALILLYGLGHRAAMDHAAAAMILCRTRRSIRQIEHDALLEIESILYEQAHPSQRMVRFSKTYKIWMTLEEQRLSKILKRRGKDPLTAQPLENPHPKGISDSGDTARQWLQDDAHMVWVRKQRWVAEHLPVLVQHKGVDRRQLQLMAPHPNAGAATALSAPT